MARTRTTHHNPKYENGGKGNFNLSYHLEMVSDTERTSLLKSGIDKVVNADTVFCDLGCGTGIFSIYAARKAKKVYAVEIDEKTSEIAKQNIRSSGLSEKITLLNQDASTVELPGKVDVVFCEMLSTWMIEEPQVLVMNHAVKNLMKPKGIAIPGKIINLAELCNVDYTFDNIHIKTPIAQFTGIKHPRIMTESKVFNVISLNQLNPEQVLRSIEFELLTSGRVNSARISSIVRITDGVNFYSTDTMMPLTIVPLENEVNVREGQKIRFTANYKHRERLEEAKFKIELI